MPAARARARRSRRTSASSRGRARSLDERELDRLSTVARWSSRDRLSHGIRVPLRVVAGRILRRRRIFVLSGYLITSILWQEHLTRRNQPCEVLSARFLRLAPALVVFVGAAWAVASAVAPAEVETRWALFTIFYVSNLAISTATTIRWGSCRTAGRLEWRNNSISCGRSPCARSSAVDSSAVDTHRAGDRDRRLRRATHVLDRKHHRRERRLAHLFRPRHARGDLARRVRARAVGDRSRPHPKISAWVGRSNCGRRSVVSGAARHDCNDARYLEPSMDPRHRRSLLRDVDRRPKTPRRSLRGLLAHAARMARQASYSLYLWRLAM
jgi:hypothetical protein